MPPKVFLSYSWSSARHRERVRLWAERLVSDGIDVVLDVYDLKEGHDKYAFMERMVTDATVTHVLVISDKDYATKADKRRSGVGTESQIISREVYDKVDQSKFIPIATEFDDDSEPYLPTFLKSRIWMDFSSPESENENWERLVRTIYGKPLFEKPVLGAAPLYIREPRAVVPSQALARFNTLKQAIVQGKPGIGSYRREFLEAAIASADSLRIRQPPTEPFGERVLEDCTKLKATRDLLVDWVLLESEMAASDDFVDAVTTTLESLLEMKHRPPELSHWSDRWFEAHALFAYETFLYFVAALIKTKSFSQLHEVFSAHYLLPETERRGTKAFSSFQAFYTHSEALQGVLAAGRRFLSPAAELIRRQADRNDLPFNEVMQGELVTLMAAFIREDTDWYPGTLLYASGAGAFPLFLRATRRRDYQPLAIITGISEPDELRRRLKQGNQDFAKSWGGYSVSGFRSDFTYLMNVDHLGTL